jgi:hypothetical protein
MSPYLALVLVCPLSIAPAACDETTAVDVIKTRVETELGCTRGWQEIIARGSLREGIGRDVYLKTVCRHLLQPPRRNEG